MKKILLLLLAILALFSISGCTKKERSINEDVLSVNTFAPNNRNVKLLGRAVEIDDTLWLAYSGAGAEFSFKGRSAEITFLGDDNIVNEDFNSLPRIAVFVDGERVLDKIICEPKTSFNVFSSDQVKEVTIRIVKLSETDNSTCAIESVKVEAYGRIRPTDEKEHSIEFIGDSITCGYGVDGDLSKSFSTGTEDCTKAYAYRTAELLNADYSLVSKSGNGIVSGYTSVGVKAQWGILPEYYGSIGAGNGNYKGKSPYDTKWDFKHHSYDVVVINLGTNDFSYTGNEHELINEFKEGYIEFLKNVRKLNPESRIICTLGIMGDNLYPAVKSAVDDYSQQNNDRNIIAFRFDVQDATDGYGSDWHPSEITHQKSAKKLSEFIKDQMGW